MKKNKKTTEDSGCCCKSIFDCFKGEMGGKAEKVKKYVKENPETTKKILAGFGAFLTLIIAFLLNKKINKNKKKTKK